MKELKDVTKQFLPPLLSSPCLGRVCLETLLVVSFKKNVKTNPDAWEDRPALFFDFSFCSFNVPAERNNHSDGLAGISLPACLSSRNPAITLPFLFLSIYLFFTSCMQVTIFVNMIWALHACLHAIRGPDRLTRNSWGKLISLVATYTTSCWVTSQQNLDVCEDASWKKNSGRRT